MQSLWADFLGALRQPEYVHVLLHPLPIFGLAAGVFVLAAALILRSRPAQVIALVLILLTAASAWLVAHFGHEAYDRVYSLSYADAQSWLEWHRHLAGRIVWAYYATAALAAGALVSLWKYPRLQRLAVGCTLAAALIAIGLGGFLAFVGGKIRHSEFRHGPPPAWADTAADDH